MIFVWRGWAGAVGAFMTIMGGGAGAGLGANLGINPMLSAGIGLLLTGGATFLLGRWANLVQPEQKFHELVGARRAQLQHFVDQGTFHLGAGHQPPRSLAEAQAQADAVLAGESQRMRDGLFNHHHFFFIPIHWLGLAAAGLGLFLLVAGVAA